ncbi:DapH/DapD/GlmU-related protein [Oceanicoccus sp. KOV_DT_Chl]|uniref:acyltransferase n=1 Tax=Oceanicoccus sp. KOV_DT_Chl TaxID=1904639 RepID=UPI00135A6B39|nr:acyltransferase [Oceanicoccus sp. KOV_DT_Chl]
MSVGKGLHIGKTPLFWAAEKITIADNVYIGKDVNIECNCQIGSYVLIANRVALLGRMDHDFRVKGIPVRFSPWVGSKKNLSPFSGDKVVIEDDVWLGYGVIVLTGVTIGKGSIIAAGSLVTKDIPPYSIAAGSPVRVIKKRFEREADILEHEALIATGSFKFSERGFDHFVIEPGRYDK